SSLFFFILLLRLHTSPLFPYTTLFRSQSSRRSIDALSRGLRARGAWAVRPCALRRALDVRRVEARARIGLARDALRCRRVRRERDRKSTRLNSSHVKISYAVFCLKKKK